MGLSRMRIGLTTVLLLLGLLTTGGYAFYEKDDSIVALTAANFDAKIYSSPHPWIIEFYAPWCGHCQRLVPEYEKAAQNMKGIFKFGAVNCDDEKNREVCGRFGIQGFPTLKIFPGSSTQNKKGFVKDPKDYQGARTARAMVDACTSEIPSFVVKVTSQPSSGKVKNIEDFLGASTPKALIFTTKPTTSPLLKALSVDFYERLTLGEVRDTDKEIVKKYEITKFPALLAVPADGSQPVLYEGALKHDELSKFLGQYALPPKAGQSGPKDEKASGKQTPPPEKEPFNPEVIHVKTQKQLKEECLDKPTGMCLLSFMVVEPEYEESVKEHQAQLEVLKAVKKTAHDKSLIFRVLWLDALQEKALMNKFSLSDQVPSLMIVGPNKKVYRPFTGAFDHDSIIDFLTETTKGKGRHFKYDFEPTLSISE